MTTQYAVLPARSGRTLTAKLFTLAAPDTVAFTADTVAERTNAKGEYICTFGEASAISGDHKLVLFYGSLAAAIGFVTFAGTDAETATETPPTAVLDPADKATLVNLIWDEPLTGATHNVATSSGKRLRQTTAFQQIDSTVIDAAATTTTFVTGLTSSVDNFYNDSMLVFTDGALAGQVRAIYDYIGATKTIILEEALTSAPVNGVAFAIVSLHIHPVSQIQSGLATAAALATESTKINRIEAVATGTVTGAGTSTEVFVGPSATLTIAVDSSGNRSAVVVT